MYPLRLKQSLIKLLVGSVKSKGEANTELQANSSCKLRLTYAKMNTRGVTNLPDKNTNRIHTHN